MKFEKKILSTLNIITYNVPNKNVDSTTKNVYFRSKLVFNFFLLDRGYTTSNKKLINLFYTSTTSKLQITTFFITLLSPEFFKHFFFFLLTTNKLHLPMRVVFYGAWGRKPHRKCTQCKHDVIVLNLSRVQQ